MKQPLRILSLALFMCLSLVLQGNAQTDFTCKPLRYIGGIIIDPKVHEGWLRYAIGVESRHKVRVNRTHLEYQEDYGCSYNHASNLAYRQGKFYQQYLSNTVDEHISPGHTLLTTSPDRRNWSRPQVIFPQYEAPAPPLAGADDPVEEAVNLIDDLRVKQIY